MDKEVQQRTLRKAFSDIARGYSSAFLGKKRLYIKHLSHHDQVDLDVLYKSFLDEGIADGLESEKDVLKRLAEDGVWTAQDEKELVELEAVIERLAEGKKVLYRKSEIDNQNKEIAEYRKKFTLKQRQKIQFLGLTAESFAEKKINEYYIIESFFEDDKFTKKYLSDEMFDNLSDKEINEIVGVYNQEMEVIGDKNIKLLAIQNFFQLYWSLSGDNLHGFFGVPICDLTYAQIKLSSYGRTFKDIMAKASTLPDDIREDPDKILDYIRAGENAKEKMEGKSSQGPKEDGAVASTLIGAKSEDYKSIGVKDKGAVSLSEELKKKQAEGKKGLNMQEMMQLMGVNTG